MLNSLMSYRREQNFTHPIIKSTTMTILRDRVVGEVRGPPVGGGGDINT